MANLSVEVPPLSVFVSKVIRATDPKDNPTYGNWKKENRLRCMEIFGSMAMAGHSYAKVQLTSGEPVSAQVDVEDATSILNAGDRVSIGLETSQMHTEWKFCGYVVSTSMSIEANTEGRVWKIAGPEYVWGDGDQGGGAGYVISGILRRDSTSDDAWIQTPSTVTPYTGTKIFDDEMAVFNPGGRKNMSRNEVVLSSPDEASRVQGHCFETPNRRFNSIDLTMPWDMRQASKYVVHAFGELKFTGIQPPDWNDVEMSILDKMYETSIEGVGPYEALRRILGNRYTFYIECFPTEPVQGNSWGPFRLVFIKRSTGIDADFSLNPRGTNMAVAEASVKRLDAAADVSKTVNRVVVQGSFVRSLKLMYWGGKTSSLTDAQKKTALQHGWYSGTGGGTIDSVMDVAGGKREVNQLMPGVDKATRQAWLDRIVTTGKDHLQYHQVFRRFTWNESGELDGTKTNRYATSNSSPFVPNLNGIANSPDALLQTDWYRRNRKLLDTLYLRDGTSNDWIKHPPQLYMAIAKLPTDTDYTKLKWRLISNQYYQIDRDRAAFEITAIDLAEWKPFEHQMTDENEADADRWPDDERSFATLLAQGTLRMCLECSISCDASLQGKAERSVESGSPFYREIRIQARANFLVSSVYADGLNPPPSGVSPTVVDQRADTTRQAEITRDSTQDVRVHSSIITAGDWPLQPLGSHVRTVRGRQVNLTAAGGNGAMIVAYRIDPVSLHIEYLTESLAKSVLREQRKLINREGSITKNAQRSSSFRNG